MIGNAYSIALDFLVEMVAHRLQWTETPISRFSISYLFYVGLCCTCSLSLLNNYPLCTSWVPQSNWIAMTFFNLLL